MADTPQTLSLLALGQELRGDILAQMNRRSALLQTLPVVPGAGQNCAWAVEGDGQIGESFADGATASNFGSDAQLQALLSWGRYWSPFHVTGTARRAARSAGAGPGGVRDLIGRNIKNSCAKLASTINAGLFSGAGTTNLIAGLDVAIGDDTNTYASLARGSYSYWQPTVVDPGSSTAPTFAQIRSDRTDIFTNSGEMPDLAFCSPAVFDTIGGLYDATRRYVTDITTAKGAVKLDAGFAALEFDGMMFIRDKDATAGQIYYVNSNYVEIQYQPLDQVAMFEVGAAVQGTDGVAPMPLGFQVAKLAKNGDADRYMVLCELQLVVRKPNACGVRKNVATS